MSIRTSVFCLACLVSAGCGGNVTTSVTPEEAMEAWPELRTLAEELYSLQQLRAEGANQIPGSYVVRMESTIESFVNSEVPGGYDEHAEQIETAKSQVQQLLSAAQENPNADISSELNDAAAEVSKLPGGTV